MNRIETIEVLYFWWFGRGGENISWRKKMFLVGRLIPTVTFIILPFSRSIKNDNVKVGRGLLRSPGFDHVANKFHIPMIFQTESHYKITGIERFKGRYANTMQFVSIYLRCVAHLQTLTGFHFPMMFLWCLSKYLSV